MAAACGFLPVFLAIVCEEHNHCVGGKGMGNDVHRVRHSGNEGLIKRMFVGGISDHTQFVISVPKGPCGLTRPITAEMQQRMVQLGSAQSL